MALYMALATCACASARAFSCAPTTFTGPEGVDTLDRSAWGRIPVV